MRVNLSGTNVLPTGGVFRVAKWDGFDFVDELRWPQARDGQTPGLDRGLRSKRHYGALKSARPQPVFLLIQNILYVD